MKRGNTIGHCITGSYIAFYTLSVPLGLPRTNETQAGTENNFNLKEVTKVRQGSPFGTLHHLSKVLNIQISKISQNNY